MVTEFQTWQASSSSAIRTGAIVPLSGDITQSAHRQALLDFCQERWNALDVLINNAGAGAIGFFTSASPERMRAVMELDFFAPVELTRAFLPLLRRGNRPAVMMINSVLGHRGVPLKSEYCAAKFALRGWTESLRCELARECIDVLNVSPSTTRSEFFDSLVHTDAGQKSSSIGSMSPEEVARLAITGLIKSKREMILSWGGKLLVLAGSIFPRILDRILSRSIVHADKTQESNKS